MLKLAAAYLRALLSSIALMWALNLARFREHLFFFYLTSFSRWPHPFLFFFNSDSDLGHVWEYLCEKQEWLVPVTD